VIPYEGNVKIILLTLLSLLGASTALATSGHELRKWMGESEKYVAHTPGANAYQAGVYDGYIGGVADSLAKLICPRSDVTRGQMIDVVSRYLKENPEELELDADLIVAKALVKAFPCKK
jgi:hypothetical protein